jgi:sugar lactone lactonase YvrE
MTKKRANNTDEEATMRRFPSMLGTLSILVTVCSAATPVNADGSFPAVVPLPLGFRPEGITHGDHQRLYIDNFDHGAIYEADARTGIGHILVPASENRMGLGIKFDTRTHFLFTAGGTTGRAFVWDAGTGAPIAEYLLAAGDSPTFINDLIITPRAVYFTDSFRPTVYELPLGDGGQLPQQGAVKAITLVGDYQFIPTTDPNQPVFNGNGIERTPDHRALLVMNSKTGKLYTMDPRTGVTDEIELGGLTLPTCDGFLLLGRTLYVVQNTNNIAVIALSHDGGRGRLVRNITNPNFDTLATATFLDDALYVTNPRFQVPVPDGQPFNAVRVPIEE